MVLNIYLPYLNTNHCNRVDEELPLSIDEPNDENGVNLTVKFK